MYQEKPGQKFSISLISNASSKKTTSDSSKWNIARWLGGGAMTGRWSGCHRVVIRSKITTRKSLARCQVRHLSITVWDYSAGEKIVNIAFEEAVFWSSIQECDKSVLGYVAKITGLFFSEGNPQLMCFFIIANNIYFAGFNRMHFHNYRPLFKNPKSTINPNSSSWLFSVAC